MNNNKKGLIVAYILDGAGGAKEIDWQQIEQWTPEQGTLWVHLDYTAQEAKNWLTHKSGLDQLTVNAMTTKEIRPRSLVTQQGILLFLRGVNLNPGQDPEDMVSIRVWVDEHRIITTRRQKLLSMTDLYQSLMTGRGPKNSIEFLIMLIDYLTTRIADVVSGLDEQVDVLEEKILRAQTYQLRIKISEIRRQAVTIRKFLAPQREALYRLQIEKTSLLNQSDQFHIRESTDQIIHHIEDLDSARERATIIQEELTSRITEQMERRMYLLSVVAIIFLPLGFITGLLGMNVGGIPGAKSDWGFAIVCIVSLLMIGITFWVFRKKKWM